jgi:hypothetical protein
MKSHDDELRRTRGDKLHPRKKGSKMSDAACVAKSIMKVTSNTYFPPTIMVWLHQRVARHQRKWAWSRLIGSN